ncbi:MAG: putative nucleic acid-binding protein [Candidatus Nitrosomirales archaeon]|jgi:predicted nucleic acid-binding protein
MSYLIDTNIFLEVMLSRTRKEECKNLLKQVSAGKIKGILTDFSLYSIMLIMASRRKYSEIKRFLQSLTAYKGLIVYSCTLDDKMNCIDLILDERMDVDDSIQYASALSLNARAIVSFDAHFDGLKIPREEPGKIHSNIS